MVMKTLKGARMNDMRGVQRPGRTFSQAAFRWVLSDPSVDGLVISMTSTEAIDEFVEASGSGGPIEKTSRCSRATSHRTPGRAA